MKFSLEKSFEIWERTPQVLSALLSEISDEWTTGNEGPDTFSPYDVIGHLIHGEKTDWTARIALILEEGPTKTFVPYDRFAMFEESKGKTLQQLLQEFAAIRKKNMDWLRSLNLTPVDLDKKGTHPKFGEVSLRQLLSTWTTHDLSHTSQITRVMAKQYREEIGPWLEYFPRLQ